MGSAWFSVSLSTDRDDSGDDSDNREARELYEEVSGGDLLRKASAWPGKRIGGQQALKMDGYVAAACAAQLQ